MYRLKAKAIIIVFGSVLFILGLIALATLLSDEVRWGPEDFLMAGVMLFGLGILSALAMKYISKKSTRIIVIVLGVSMVLLLWVELAVGIFGSPFAGN